MENEPKRAQNKLQVEYWGLAFQSVPGAVSYMSQLKQIVTLARYKDVSCHFAEHDRFYTGG